MKILAKALVHGASTGALLHADVPLSFWGGINSETGEIIDRHHPLSGAYIKDRILALPGTRGSCSGSLVLIELLVNGKAPAAIIFRDTEEIVTTGAIVAQILLDLSIPILRVSTQQYETLSGEKYAYISGNEIFLSDSPLPLHPSPPPAIPNIETHISLTEQDKSILNGSYSPAASKAMYILLQYAHLQDAHQLTPITRAHIDACIYTGPASLLIATTFLTHGARVAVPTTLNSISIDQRRWREVGMNETMAKEANKLANTYVAMGAHNSFTCAPYLLDSDLLPKEGESIGWAESNAVVFANSVLGARTQKYPDLIDVCIALTGRAPLAGTQTVKGRVPGVCVNVRIQKSKVEEMQDAFWPLLGYAVGKVAGGSIPLITGLEGIKPQPTISDLKAFGAAFATTASAAMFHIAGVTLEAGRHSPAGLKPVALNEDSLRSALRELTTATDDTVGLVSLGNPHFSLEEFARLSDLCTDRHRADGVQIIITTNRKVYAQACAAGYVSILESFGADILTDTCWCMIPEEIIDGSVRNLMTNSAKYAHYAPGIVHRGVHFGSLGDCLELVVVSFEYRVLL
ncbi:hypothetical protein BDV12DRAFT_198948 [Aspergillus spectabilis]